MSKNKGKTGLDDREKLTIEKLSFAGGRKSNFKTDLKTANEVLEDFFRAPLEEAKKVTVTNFGIKKHLKSYDLFSYKETREFLAGFHVKRVVCEGGIETMPIKRVFIKTMNRPNNCYIVDESQIILV